jgi:hypothetical protein
MSECVAELMKGMNDEAQRALADVLGRYVEMVRKAAESPLSRADAVVAASIAYELGLTPERFDRDVATVKAEAVLAKQLELDAKAASTSRSDMDNDRAKLAALEKQVNEQRVVMQRRHVEALVRQERRVQHAKVLAESPHLFKPADQLTSADWQEVRA